MKPGFNAPTLFILALVSFFLPWIKEDALQLSGLYFALDLNYIPNYVGLIAPAAGLYFIHKGNLKNAFIAACVCLGLVVNWYLYIIPVNDLSGIRTGDASVDGMASNFIKSKIRESFTFGFYLYAVCSALLVYLTASELGLFKSQRPVEGRAAEGSAPSEAAGSIQRDQNTKARPSPVQRSKAKPVSIDLKDPKIRKAAILALIGALGYGGYSYWDKTRVIQIDDPYAFAMEFKNDSISFLKKYMDKTIEIEVHKIQGEYDDDYFVYYPKRDVIPEGFNQYIEQIRIKNLKGEDTVSGKNLTELEQTRKYIFYSPSRKKFIREKDMIQLVFGYISTFHLYDFKYTEQDPYERLNSMTPNDLKTLPGYFGRRDHDDGWDYKRRQETIDQLIEGVEYMELVKGKDEQVFMPEDWGGVNGERFNTYYSKFKIRGKIVSRYRMPRTMYMYGGIVDDIVGRSQGLGMWSKNIALVLADVTIVSHTSIMDPTRKKTIKLAPEAVEASAPISVVDSTLMPESSDSGMNVNGDESEDDSDQDEEDTTTPSSPMEATVVVDKAFFHSEPDAAAKSTKYLIRDNTFRIISQTSEFYYAEFTNEQSIVTRGWILKSDASVQ